MSEFHGRARLAVMIALLSLAGSAWSQSSDFTLSAGEKTFRLSAARGQFVALHLLLKTECPYCQQLVAESSRRADELAGVVHVFAKPDSESEIQSWTAKLKEAGISATIYRDPDARLASEFKIPGGFQFHGQSVHFPATILFGPDGRERFRYVGKDNADRLSFDRLAEKVVEFSRGNGTAEANLGKDGLALSGYDPVSYVDGSKPAEGKAAHISRYRGVTYRFVSPENRAKFAADPERYVPAYGGWCATAMAEGRKVEVDLNNFKITHGRLFLFYKGWLGNALNDWNKDEKNLTVRADAEWRKIAPDASKGGE